MKHSQADADVAAIRRAHGQFLSKGRVPEGIVPDFIERSWRRSAAFGVAHDRIREIGRVDEADLRVAVSQYGSLINFAAPVMENLRYQLTGSGSVVLLCSGDGFILHSLGDPDFLPKAQHVALKPGVSWAEEQKGTNAIGTAIAERKPVVVYAGHHYIRQNHFLACSATPVLDPFGDVAGVLDITCDYRWHQRHTLALVQMAVRVIERQMFQHRFCRDVVFNVHPERNYLGSPFDVQMAFSEDGEFLAATPSTCSELHILPGAFHGRFEELFGASFEQILHRLARVSPPVLQMRMQGDGRPVFLQLAQPANTRPALSGTPPASAGETEPPHRAAPPRLTLETVDAADPSMRANVEKARRTLGRDIPILLEGETGSGKEWFARAIHNSGARARGEFVALNCAAIPDVLIESELFGHEEAAQGRRKGALGSIQRADGGTLVLDEIGEMPMPAQARLLRVLQERAVAAPGETPVEVDMGLICATHHRLAALVAAGRFREDLYYRVNGITLTLPPLRDRGDIARLAQAMLLEECGTTRNAAFSPEVIAIFGRHPWPGNVRQMHSVIRAAAAMMDDEPTLERRHLPDDFLAQLQREPEPPPARAPSSPAAATESLEEIELHAIQETVRHNNGNISAAARQLGVSRTTLYRKLRQPEEAAKP
jgi:transcriptional regulator of acetoin/glycerol metabolism